VPEIDEAKVETKEPELTEPEEKLDDDAASIQPITTIQSSNPTISLGRLMLINPNFTVEPSFIAERKTELISLTDTYGIKENKASNGDNLLDREAAEWLNKMVAEYSIANPGHALETRSCFREVGTGCGRMCAATGASDHHTGLTCDLIDPIYGTSLDTGEYNKHIEWQWLKNNSYKFGFIDRFPEAWAGGPMTEPINVDENGTTGLFETWHYRYVGVYAATQIATGVYNDGAYDSLEHYLKMRGLVPNLLNK
jgi:D-alanyl-D-alanine carboxypeptidase